MSLPRHSRPPSIGVCLALSALLPALTFPVVSLAGYCRRLIQTAPSRTVQVVFL